MKQNKISAIFLSAFFAFSEANFLFAQSEAEGMEHEELDLEELENQGDQTYTNPAIDPALQKSLVIVEPARFHELNQIGRASCRERV